MSRYGTPAQLLAVEYDAGMGPIVLGLYVAPGQYPVGAILTPDGGPVGVAPTGSFLPYVGDPITTGIAQCVACFASAGVRVWTTEDVEVVR